MFGSGITKRTIAQKGPVKKDADSVLPEGLEALLGGIGTTKFLDAQRKNASLVFTVVSKYQLPNLGGSPIELDEEPMYTTTFCMFPNDFLKVPYQKADARIITVREPSYSRMKR
jgi:hypothetical protein